MDSSLIQTAGEIGLFASSIAAVIFATINGLTMYWPERPGWVAFFGGLGLSILLTIILAAATLPVDDPWTRQTWAQIGITSISAWLTATGLNSTSQAAAGRQNRRRRRPAPESTTESRSDDPIPEG